MPDALASAVSDTGTPDRYADRPTVNEAELTDALSAAVDRVDRNLDELYDRFPRPSSDDLVYRPTGNTRGWTTGF